METTFPVTVHEYPPAKPDDRPAHAYEHVTSSSSSSSSSSPSPSPARNALVFVGGLGDGPHDVPYVRAIARKLAGTPSISYSVFEARLSSSFSGYGHGSLARDAEEIGALVAHLRAGLGREKVVLMGHSTGCQDGMEYAGRMYATSGWEDRKGVDGFVLQGPVSDREAIVMEPAEMEESVAYAARLVAGGRGREVMPRERLPEGFRETPLTAYRWHSLAAVGGDDDYFSSDLPDDKVAAFWGRLRQPVLILLSGEDEFVPASVDVGKLVERWKGFCRPGIASDLSGLIPGANHRVDDAKAQEWLAERVARFLEGLEK